MKKLFTILLILVSFSGFSQTWNRVFYRPGYQYNGLKIDSIAILPNDTLRNKVVGSIAVKNNQLYIKETNKWKMLTGVDILSSYRLLNNHDSLSTLEEKSYNSLTDKPNLLIYRLNNDHDSLLTLQEKSYNSLDNKPDLTIYRPLNNHDSLSTLQEKSYNSLDDKPTIPDVTSYRLKSDHDSLSTLQEKSYSSLDGKPDLTVYKIKSDSTNSDGYTRRDRLTTELNKKADKTALTSKADLDGNGKVLSTQIPAIAISETFVVSSQSAMLALSTAETGDVAVRNDINKSFILTQNPASTLSNWQELLTPTDAVSSVNGQTGTVSLTTSNINEGSNLYYTEARVVANSAVAANTAKVSFPGFGTSHSLAAYGDHNHSGVYQPAGTYVTSESDPVFSAWNKSTGISITKSQVSDFPTQLSQFTNNLGNYGNFLTSESDPTIYPWAKAATKPSYTAGEVGALASDGTAVNSTKWNGFTITNTTANSPDYLIGWNNSANTASFMEANLIKIWLGLGASAFHADSYFSLSGHDHAGVYDPFGTASGLLSTHNSTYDHSHIATAFGWGNWADHFGTGTGTIAQGNDSRINNGQTAYDWGNHAGLYLPLNAGASYPLTGDLYVSGSHKIRLSRASYEASLYGEMWYDVGSLQLTSAEGYFTFGKGNSSSYTPYFSIIDGGFVGIGYTSNPTSGNKFAVNGNAYIGGDIEATGYLLGANLGISGDAQIGGGVGAISVQTNTFYGSGSSSVITFNSSKYPYSGNVYEFKGKDDANVNLENKFTIAMSGDIWAKGGASFGGNVTAPNIPIGGNKAFSGAGTQTVTIGQTMANTNYKVCLTPLAEVWTFYVTNKTTTTFDIVVSGEGLSSFSVDWILLP